MKTLAFCAALALALASDLPVPIPAFHQWAAQQGSGRRLAETDVNRYFVRFANPSEKSSVVEEVLKAFPLETASETSWAHLDHSFYGPGVEDAALLELSSNAVRFLKERGVAQIMVDGVAVNVSAGSVAGSAAPITIPSSSGFIGIKAEQVLSSAFYDAWALDRVDQKLSRTLDRKYRYDYTGTGVDLYFVGSGIYATHTEVNGRVATGVNYVTGGVSTDTSDCLGYGTHNAAMAMGTNVGVAKQATAIPMRIYGCSNSAYYTDVVKALQGVSTMVGQRKRRSAVMLDFIDVYNKDNTWHVQISSLVQGLLDSNIAVVLPAGGASQAASLYYPQMVRGAITVGNTILGDTASTGVNTGEFVDLFAPGDFSLSAWKSGASDYSNNVFGSGVAASTAMGVVALALEQFPLYSTAEVERCVVESATVGGVLSPPTGTTSRYLHSFLTALAPSPSGTPSATPSQSTPPTGTPSSTHSATPSRSLSATSTPSASASTSATTSVSPSSVPSVHIPDGWNEPAVGRKLSYLVPARM